MQRAPGICTHFVLEEMDPSDAAEELGFRARLATALRLERERRIEEARSDRPCVRASR